MEHFSKHGFRHKERNELSEHTRSVIIREEETKVMTCNL